MRQAALEPGRPDNLFAPVTSLHRTRGAFSDRASDSALILSGQATRAAVVIAGAVTFFILGLLPAPCCFDRTVGAGKLE